MKKFLKSHTQKIYFFIASAVNEDYTEKWADISYFLFSAVITTVAVIGILSRFLGFFASLIFAYAGVTILGVGRVMFLDYYKKQKENEDFKEV